MNSFYLRPSLPTTAISTVRDAIGDISVFSSPIMSNSFQKHLPMGPISQFIQSGILTVNCNCMPKLTRKIMSVSAPKLSLPEARSWPRSCKPLNYETRHLVGSGLSFPVSPRSIILIFHEIFRNRFFAPALLPEINLNFQTINPQKEEHKSKHQSNSLQ